VINCDVTKSVRYCASTNISIKYRAYFCSWSVFFSKFKLYISKELNFLFTKMFSIYDPIDQFSDIFTCLAPHSDSLNLLNTFQAFKRQ
jgi:hypothetical protein